jgi:hypothetical protein
MIRVVLFHKIKKITSYPLSHFGGVEVGKTPISQKPLSALARRQDIRR